MVHGLLAGQIFARCKLNNQPGKWTETLVATNEFDDVLNEFDRNLLIDKHGAPINFKEARFIFGCIYVFSGNGMNKKSQNHIWAKFIGDMNYIKMNKTKRFIQDY